MQKILLTAKTRLFTRNVALVSICILLACLFAYTGISKLMDYQIVKAQMSRSPFIQSMAGFLAWAVPLWELLIAALLSVPAVRTHLYKLPPLLARVSRASPPARLLGLYVSYGLMLLFTGYVFIMLKFAYDLPCSCGGIISELSWKGHLIVNSLFTGLALTGILIHPKKIKATSNLSPESAYA